MRALLAGLMLAVAAPAFAEQPDLTDLVTDTLGYVPIRPDVVLLEGDDMGSFVCKFDVPDEAFSLYAEDASVPDGMIGYVCIPLEEFEN